MDGFQNEFNFIIAINSKKIKEINPLLQDLLYGLYEKVNEDSVIKAWKNHIKQKSDIFIKIDNTIKRISIKKGARNSVHTESLNTFKAFLKQNYIEKKYIDYYVNYHNGYNKNGKKISSEEYKSTHQKEIDDFNNKLQDPQLLLKVINRFVLKGNIFNDNVDAIVHGTPNDFVWINQKEVFIIILSKINDYKTSPHFGPLVIQPMSRCLNENPKYLYAQNYIQVKWYSLFDDIIEYKEIELHQKMF